MLKDWLIRRRQNPYPSRDEKKILANETGLTYTQICNWFANWRRKLKNSEQEKAKKSWGHLIKNYNINAKGNVEQFSISSADSIWEEALESGMIEYKNGEINIETSLSENSQTCPRKETSCLQYYMCSPSFYKDAITLVNFQHNGNSSQCDQISSTTTDDDADVSIKLFQPQNFFTTVDSYQQELSSTKTKYKQQIMEKYLRDTTTPQTSPSSATEFTKWLESAAKFTPNKNNYYVEWSNKRYKYVLFVQFSLSLVFFKVSNLRKNRKYCQNNGK